MRFGGSRFRLFFSILLYRFGFFLIRLYFSTTDSIMVSKHSLFPTIFYSVFHIIFGLAALFLFAETFSFISRRIIGFNIALARTFFLSIFSLLILLFQFGLVLVGYFSNQHFIVSVCTVYSVYAHFRYVLPCLMNVTKKGKNVKFHSYTISASK